MSRGVPKIAADMLDGRVALDIDSAELRLLADAVAHEFPIRERAVQFFGNLAPEIRGIVDFQRIEGDFHFNRGASSDAIAPYMGAYEQNPRIEHLMALIFAHLRCDEREAVVQLVKDEAVDYLPGSPRERINLCQVLLELGEGERAIALGYRRP